MAQPKLQSYIRERYTLIQMIIAGTIEITGSGATDYQLVYNRDEYTTTRTDMLAFILSQRPVEGNACKITLTGVNSSNAFGAGTPADEITIPAYTAVGKGALVTLTGTDPVYWKSIASVALDGTDHGTIGEMYDIVLLPKWNDNDAVDGSDGFCDLRYVRGGDITPGATMTPIADRMDPVATSIAIRGSNTFTISANYVTNNYVNGLARLKGRKLCFLKEIRENGGAQVVEYIYLGNAVLNEVPISMPDNAEMMVNATGYFDKIIHYEA